MDLDTYATRLRDNLVSAAALGGDTAKTTAQALADATDQANRLVVFHALSDLAAEISGALDGQAVHVSLADSGVKVDIRDTVTPPPPQDGHTTFEDLTGDISRVTLRLVDQIKEKAEEAASQSGLSLNSWVSQAVKNALRDNWHGHSSDYYKGWSGDWKGSARPDDDRGGAAATSGPKSTSDTTKPTPKPETTSDTTKSGPAPEGPSDPAGKDATAD